MLLSQDRLRTVQQESSRQAERVAELEAAPPPDSPRKKELKARLRDAEQVAPTRLSGSPGWRTIWTPYPAARRSGSPS